MESFSSWMRVFQYYDGLGVLIRRGLLDKTLVAYMISSTLKSFWEKNKAIEKEAREYYNRPDVIEETDYLYNLIKEITDHNNEHKTNYFLNHPSYHEFA